MANITNKIVKYTPAVIIHFEDEAIKHREEIGDFIDDIHDAITIRYAYSTMTIFMENEEDPKYLQEIKERLNLT